MGFFTDLIPKRFRKKDETDKPAEYKNNVPKEKDNIKKSFAVYCNGHHGTKDGKGNGTDMRTGQRHVEAMRRRNGGTGMG